MSDDFLTEAPSDRTDALGGSPQKRVRKPYTKPMVQTVVIHSKNEVLGNNCFTSVQTSQQPANGCRLAVPICFS